MDSRNIQKQIFEQISQHIAPVNLAEDIAKLFNTTKSSVYRRINGETALSMEELMILLKHYPFLSFDKLTRPHQVSYTFPSLTGKPNNTFAYLNTMEQSMQQIALFPNALIGYAAQEIPFFHYLMLPEMAAFKFYVWSRTVWGLETARNKSFDLSEYEQDDIFRNQIHRLFLSYASIDSEEIWHSNMPDITLNQVRHAYLSGYFKNKADMLKVLTSIRVLIENMRKMAASGEKKATNFDAPSVGNLKVWYNELVHHSAVILVQLTEKQRFIYNIFDAPNFIYSHDPSVCAYSFTFFDRLKTYALPVFGGVNERNLVLLFQRIDKKIEAFEQELITD
ncbi:MAG: hypothetical protein HC817_09530 [Saprospiraceae bacterium]|nr:hypothetical protein [Saprospiraceae bacterium]